MIKFIIKTILQFVLILLCVSFISFLLVYLAPGDPAESILNAQGIPFTKELLEIKRAEMGLWSNIWPGWAGLSMATLV